MKTYQIQFSLGNNDTAYAVTEDHGLDYVSSRISTAMRDGEVLFYERGNTAIMVNAASIIAVSIEEMQES